MNKFAAIALALLLSLGSVQTVSAAGTNRIDGINGDRWYDGQSVMQDAADVRDLTSIRASAGSEVRIYLDADMFVDAEGQPLGTQADGVTKADIKSGRVSVAVAKQKNANLVKELSINYDSSRKTSYIKIKFIDPYTGTGKKTWSATLQLRVNGKAQSDTAFSVEAQLANTEISVSANTDYVQLSPTEYANPDDFIRGITVDLGEGVQIITNMYANKKYYGMVTVAEPGKAGNAQVEFTYQLTHNNLGTAGNICKLNLDEDFYVYGSDGGYLGTTKDDLPVVRTYHFTKEYVEELELEGRGESGQAASSGRGGGKK